MNDRTCIVTRQCLTADQMIRFVAAPDGTVVADLKGRLPGRGCWVTASRECIEKAIAKKAFARALKADVKAPADLADSIEAQMVVALVGMINMARKAGQIVMGGAKVDAAIRSGKAVAVFHAVDAAADGVRKLDQARFAAVAAGSDEILSFRLLPAEEMTPISGDRNLIHLAVLAGQAGEGVVKRAKILDHYRNPAKGGRMAGDPAKETDTE
ncbi:RNA-binding protein [Hoeflea sp. CAU 1731]